MCGGVSNESKLILKEYSKQRLIESNVSRQVGSSPCSPSREGLRLKRCTGGLRLKRCEGRLVLAVQDKLLLVLVIQVERVCA